LKVIDYLNAANMTKYSFVMTPTPCRVAGCIISILKPTYAPMHLLTYLSYLRNWLWAYKTGNISETVQDKAKLAINGP